MLLNTCIFSLPGGSSFQIQMSGKQESQIPFIYIYLNSCRWKVTLIHCLCSALFSLTPSVFLNLPVFSSFCISFLFLWRALSFKLISHEPLLIVWLQSPHAAAMVTGRVYSCSELKFNTTFDDIGRMRCTRMCPCLCARVCVHMCKCT